MFQRKKSVFIKAIVLIGDTLMPPIHKCFYHLHTPSKSFFIHTLLDENQKRFMLFHWSTNDPSLWNALYYNIMQPLNFYNSFK